MTDDALYPANAKLVADAPLTALAGIETSDEVENVPFKVAMPSIWVAAEVPVI